MKKIMSLLLSCCMLFTSFVFTASAATVSTENELKAVLTDAAAAFNATNGTTKEDVLQYVESEFPTAAVWATNGNYSFKKRLATEDKAGFVNMGIGVTLDNVTIEQFIFRQDIAPLNESADAINITEDQAAMEKAIKTLAYSNATTKEEILKAAKSAAIHGTTAVWENDFSKKDATATAGGEISGTIKLTLGSETREIKVKKILVAGATGEGQKSYLPEDKSVMSSAMYAVTLTNQTTKEELLQAALAAAKHGSTAEWKSFELTESTFNESGKVKGELVITLNGESTTISFSDTIPKISSRKMPSNSISVTKEEWEVLRLTNIERYKEGKYILTMPATMQESADIREKELLVLFDHKRPDGGSYSSVFDSKFSHTATGENAAISYSTAAEAVEGWMNSDGHRANILKAEYNYMGVGYIHENKDIRWVQLFAKSGSIVSVTTSTGSTHFANADEMQKEYFICTDNFGTVSYAPIDTAVMTKDGNTYTATGLPLKNPIVLTVGDADNSASEAAEVSSGLAFTDVPSDSYYADAVKWAVKNGITSGTSGKTFSPADTCTKAQILTFLWRAVGSPKAAISNPFDDVKNSDYYYDAALWAYKKGMVQGSSFAGNTPCTRALTVEYLWKNAGAPESSADSLFFDVSANAEYAKAVAWAVANGVTSGTSDTTFSPDNICDRGQIVTFLKRALK